MHNLHNSDNFMTESKSALSYTAVSIASLEGEDTQMWADQENYVVRGFENTPCKSGVRASLYEYATVCCIMSFFTHFSLAFAPCGRADLLPALLA